MDGIFSLAMLMLSVWIILTVGSKSASTVTKFNSSAKKKGRKMLRSLLSDDEK